MYHDQTPAHNRQGVITRDRLCSSPMTALIFSALFFCRLSQACKSSMVRVCQRRSVSSSARRLGSTYRRARKPCTRSAHTKVRVSHTVSACFKPVSGASLSCIGSAQLRRSLQVCRCCCSSSAKHPRALFCWTRSYAALFIPCSKTKLHRW